MDKLIALNPNEVVAYLQKRPAEFTRADLLRFITEKGIRMVDFMYPAEAQQGFVSYFTKSCFLYPQNLVTFGHFGDWAAFFF